MVRGVGAGSRAGAVRAWPGLASARRPWVRFAAGRTVAGARPLDIAAAVLFSVIAAGFASGVLHPDPRAASVGTAAAVGVLAMTVPVAWRRGHPVAMAGLLAAAAVGHGLVFGHMVLCAGTLPAVFAVGYAAGTYCGWPAALAGFALCAVNVEAQCVYDPRLGQPVLALMLPVTAGFFALGRLVRSRNAVAARLRLASAELLRQRDLTAGQAVRTDREQVVSDLDATLREKIAGISGAVAVAREAMAADPGAACEAFAGIEHSGREVLHDMREVVGTLREAPTEPQPTLDRLAELLSRATTASTRLTVSGSPRPLPAGLELSGARIVEHLVQALEDSADASITVHLAFETDALELRVSGPVSASANPDEVVALARHRAALHGGTVVGQGSGGTYHATARLPLVSSLA